MKKWMTALLTAALLLQTACASTARAPLPAPELLERTEIVKDADLDIQKGYPPERPLVQEIIPELKPEPAETAKPEQKPETVPESPKTEEKAEEQKAPPEQPPEPSTEKEPAAAPPEKEPAPVPEKQPEPTPAPAPVPEKPGTASASQDDEIRAVWFSYFEYASLLTGQSESSFTQNIRTAFSNVASLGLNTVIVHVRPYADALYPSDYYPWSYIVTGEEGKAPGFDPLRIMIREAHNLDLDLEAWINPYRVRNGNNKEPLSSEHPVRSLLDSGDAIQYKNGIYLDPSSEEARQLIVDGVVEIVQNYPVDGIHFDDYFYPTTDAAFDAEAYSSYRNNGGDMNLGDWRRDNVNKLVRRVYRSIKQTDPSVRFGISPQGNMENNYDQQFIDVELWLSEEGYVDYICPQIYFGFDNSTCPYEETVQAWNDLIGHNDVELYIGLSPFKIGLEEAWAGDGKQEWKTARNLLGRMVETARENNHYRGFAMFRYDSMFHPAQNVSQQMNRELSYLEELFH